MGSPSFSRISLAVTIAFMLLVHRIEGRRMWSTIFTDLRLHKMARILDEMKLTSLFDAENITVYLPTSNGYFLFNSKFYGIHEGNVEKWGDLFLYSSQLGRWRLENLPVDGRIQSRLPDPSVYLYVNTFHSNGRQVTTINGAKIIQANIITDNGILHIVDRVIAPVGSHMTIAEYLETPEMVSFSFRAIILASIVVPLLTEKTNSTKSVYTSFSPNDSYLYPMPDYGKAPLFNDTKMLRKVYEAHIIEDEALFLPATIAHIPTTAAIHGNIRFYKRNGNIYICNNRVHARVVQPNIATSNGVIHVIDNLLYYVYHNALQVTDALPDTKMWAQLLSAMSQPERHKLVNQTVTMFVPTDGAFSKVPLYYQAALLRQENMVDKSALENMVYGHVVAGMNLGYSDMYDGQKLRTMSNKNLTVLNIGGEYYLESAEQRVRSKIEVKDIGVTNGVVHLISNILFADAFTIWEAIDSIPELSRIHKVIAGNFQQISTLLSHHSEQPITVFLPSNNVMNKFMNRINYLIYSDRSTLEQALKGHVISGQYSSSQMADKRNHMTVSGKIIKLWKEAADQSIAVSGDHKIAKVTVKDVFCSNGVLHIIDDLLHIPTRTIMEVMTTKNRLTYMQALITNIKDEMYNLTSDKVNYTVFVAENDAFSSVPWDTVEELLVRVNWTKRVLRAHIVVGEMRPLDFMQDGTAMQSLDNVIYVLTQGGKTKVVCNNMEANVVQADIPATNGWIHIIDRLLTVPYKTVQQVMKIQEDLSEFHELMSPLKQYRDLMTSPIREMTLFVPSTRYLRILKSAQIGRIRKSEEILKKIFYGHVLPNVRMDDDFLRAFPHDDYLSRSTYNVSFKITRSVPTDEMYVSVGYGILPLDPVRRSTGCSNGVIYVIDGLLNYSPFTLLERLKRQPGLSQSYEHMNILATPKDLALLNNPDLTFTFFMPDDYALDYFSFSERVRLHTIPADEKQRIFWRHAINGTALYYDDLKNVSLTDSLLSKDLSILLKDGGVYIHYKKINSYVKDSNLIACNGVIHVLSRFLYDVAMQKDSSSTVSTTPSEPVEPMGTKTPSPLQGCASLRCTWCILVLAMLCSILTTRT